MIVAAWLQSLGLKHYEPLFRDNEIDWEVLPKLTSEDLKEIGVRAIGHRRKLLDAIAALGTEMPAPTVTAPHETSAHADAERRQLTVMFCDLVGSTALSTRLDPEDLGEVIAAYHRAVGGVVAGFEGFIANYMGDGVLVYFGYPRAHEDDAERAVRAGLSVIDAVGRLDVKSVKLQAHIGIATGLVVVGDLIGEGSAQQQSAVGETPNLAARLEALAEPDAVVIAAGTRRLVGDLFEYRDLGAVEVKGIAAPVPAWQVLRPSGVESRFEALRGGALTPLVGRDEEIDLLLRRWARAKAGSGQVVLISGEAGLGKSRIVAALDGHVHAELHLRLRYFCSPYHQDSALFPFIDQFGRAARFAREDPPVARLKKLEELLARAAPPDEDVALLADLLSLPRSERHPLPELSPQRKKERTLEALIRQLEGLSGRQPVVMVFEDAHWIDPTSRELLDLLVERVRSLPVLLVVTFRSEFQPPWTGQSQVSLLALNRLDRRDRAVLVERIAGDKVLPDEVVAQIVDRADGVPLFVEELTKSVLESDLLREEGDRYVLDGELPPLAIPTTLHASLLARLDRLGSVRHVAQVGAAIGREFSYELLRAVSRLPEDELQAALNRLVASELIFQRGMPPDAVCAFKHVLVLDAAYGTLLRPQRQALHSRIGKVLEERFPETAATQPELLARHYTQAALVGPAIDYWRKAGERALRRSANVEAVQHLTNAIDLIHSLPRSPQRDRRELELHLALGRMIRMVKGIGAPETSRVFSRAHDLLDERATVSERMTVLYGLWGGHYVRAEHAAAREVAGECVRLAAHNKNREAAGLAKYVMGGTLWATGAFAEALSLLEQTLDPPASSGLNNTVPLASQNNDITATSFLAWTLWLLGYPERAVSTAKQAVIDARSTRHVVLISFVSFAQVFLATVFGADRDAAATDLVEAIAYCFAHGVTTFEHWVRFCQGVILARRGDPRGGIEIMTCAMEAANKDNAKLFLPGHLGHLAAAHARVGEAEFGLNLLEEAIRNIQETGERMFEAELHRLQGELLFSLGKERAAGAALKRAMAIAQNQQARMWELRAATSLARLRRDQGRHAEARDLLAPIYSWFTEGFDTADLKDAKALLEELT